MIPRSPTPSFVPNGTDYAATEAEWRQWYQAININNKRGGRFVAMYRGSKGAGLRKGWNETENTLTGEEAKDKLRLGMNIGLAAGSGNLYIFDFDEDAERGHECDRIAGTMYTYRDNATDRAKFIFQCPDPLPRRKSQTGVELLGWTRGQKHTQGVIAGVHNSGVPIRWGGNQVVTLDRDTVAALWNDWTGEELFPAESERRTLEPGSADLETVASALEHIDPWDLPYDGPSSWISVLGALHDTFGDDAYDLACQWGDEGVEERWDSFGGAGEHGATVGTIYYLARKRGWQRPQNSFLQDLRRTRLWLHTEHAAQRIKDAGLRISTGIKILDALYEICEEWGKRIVWPGLRTWATRAAVAYQTLQKCTEKLAEAGLIEIRKGEKRGEVTRIVAKLDHPPQIKVQKLDQYSSSSGIYTDQVHTTVEQSDLVLESYSLYRTNDLFRNNHAAYRKRNPNGFRPLGESCLLAISLLADGDLSVAEIAQERGMSSGTIRTALYRAHDQGIVSVDKSGRSYSFSLAEDWEDSLRLLLPNVTSYGVQLRRELQAAEDKLKFAERSGDEKRIERSAAAYNQVAGLVTDKENPAQFVSETVRPTRTYIQLDKAEQDREVADLRKQLRQMAENRIAADQARYYMELAGYSAQEITVASKGLVWSGGIYATPSRT